MRGWLGLPAAAMDGDAMTRKYVPRWDTFDAASEADTCTCAELGEMCPLCVQCEHDEAEADEREATREIYR